MDLGNSSRLCIVATPNHQFRRRVALRLFFFFRRHRGCRGRAVPSSLSKKAAESRDDSLCRGNAGSPIEGEIFHAQVLLDAAGFSPGTIDGKNGTSLPKRCVASRRQWLQSRASSTVRRAGACTRSAALDPHIKLGPDDVSGPYRLSVPQGAGGAGEAEVHGLSQHAGEGGRALPHHPGDGGCAERSGQAHRHSARRFGCPTSSHSRATMAARTSRPALLRSSTSTASSRRALRRGRQEEGVLKVYRGAPPAKARTAGSSSHNSP